MTNDQKLLKLAEMGSKRPSAETSLGRHFVNAVNPKHGKFDPVFTEQIRRLRPDWLYYRNKVGRRKARILAMAEAGIKRSELSKDLYDGFVRYTSPSSLSFDRCFCYYLKKIIPSWFKPRVHVDIEKTKQKLIRMAMTGESRPNRNDKVAGLLISYSSKSSPMYDREFSEKIRALRPDWFPRNPEEKKRQILKMARSHLSRPVPNTKLGNSLNSYVCKSSTAFDPRFNAEIRSIAPQWFRKGI